ncbi:hypothetical protein KDL44_09975 [bacterium]|nr:hypothetical protein [bacterium]
MKLPWLLAATLLLATFLIHPASAQDDNSNGLQELLQREDVIARIERGRPKPTFDLLFDQYAQAVWDANAADAFIYEPMGEHLYAAALPDEVLLQWKERWGDDPRWWELRAYCAAIAAIRDDTGNDRPREILAEAYERGVVSPSSLQLLFCLAAESEYGKQEYAEKRWYPVYSEETQQKLLGYLDDFIRIAPEHPWGWFQRGLLNISIGNEEAGLADLQACSTAADDRMLLPFPLSTTIMLLEQGKYACSPVLTGMLLQIDFINVPGQWHMFAGRRTLGWYASLQLENGNMDRLDLLESAVTACGNSLWWDLSGRQAPAIFTNSLARQCLVQYPERFSEEQRNNLYGHNVRMTQSRTRMMEGRKALDDFIEDEMYTALLPIEAPSGSTSWMEMLATELIEPGSISQAMVERGMGHYFFERCAAAHLAYWSSDAEQEELAFVVERLDRWHWTELDYEEQELSPEMQKLLEQLEQQEQEDEREARQ